MRPETCWRITGRYARFPSYTIRLQDPDAVVEVLARELELEEDYVRERVEKYSAIERIKATWIRKQAMRSAPMGCTA